LEVVLKRGVGGTDVPNLDSLVKAFYMLASTGALGGDSVSPWESKVADPGRPEHLENSIWWQFDSTSVSQPAIAILAQLIHIASPTVPIERARFSCAGEQEQSLLALDPHITDWYPRLWLDLPYEVKVGAEIGKSATLCIVFRRKVTFAERGLITTELLTWAAATSIGSYGISPIPEEECGLIPDKHPTFLEDQLELSFHNIRCHPAAFRGLLNVCVAIAWKLVPIHLVTLH